MESKESSRLVSREEVRSFIRRCMVKVGTDEEHARMLASCLEAADYRGHYSHGVFRLHFYVDDVKNKVCLGSGQPEIIGGGESAVGLVDGKNLLGVVVSCFAMDLAIEKAKRHGISIVCAKNSNHFGRAGEFAEMALEHDLIGFAATNSSPCTVAPRTAVNCLGTNPIALAAPAKYGDYYSLDMATSVVAYGKVEINALTEASIPYGWTADDTGAITTDVQKVLNGGGTLPLGGLEQTGGYKGFGMSLMVEALCGVLTGGEYGLQLSQWHKNRKQGTLSHSFIVIDPKRFATGYEDRMKDLLDSYRNVEPIEKEKRVLVPGDPERSKMEECRSDGGIRYHVNIIKHLDEIATSVGVQPIKVLD